MWGQHTHTYELTILTIVAIGQLTMDITETNNKNAHKLNESYRVHQLEIINNGQVSVSDIIEARVLPVV